MNILLVVPQDELIYNYCPNLTVLHLASIIKSQASSVSVKHISISLSDNQDEIKKIIKNQNIIAVTAFTFNWPYVIKFIKIVKNLNFKGFIILGGIHPTHFANYVMGVSGADFIVRHDGEFVFPNLINAIQGNSEIKDVLGISYKTRNGKIIHNSDSKPITSNDFDLLPLPEYELLSLSKDKYDLLPYESSRGCKYDCLFCSIPYRKNWIAKSSKTVIRDLMIIKEKYEEYIKKGIFFVDNSFIANISRAKKIFNNLIKLRYSIPIYFNARISDLTNESLLKKIEMLNVGQILVGIECGYDEGLKHIGKGLKISQIWKCAKLLKKYNLNTKMNWSFIIGFPWEDKISILKTIKFACDISNEFGGISNINWLSLYPSKLWDCRKNYSIDLDESFFDHESLSDPFLLQKKIKKIEKPFIDEVYSIVQEYLDLGINIHLFPALDKKQLNK